MFLNFSISHRSSIRRAPSVVTWVQTLNRHKLAGASTWAHIVKEWNAKVAKSSQLTGQKATVVKLLVENTPTEVSAKISEHVSKWGWAASAFSDDCLAVMKTMPGSKVKFDNGLTTSVSEESLLLMFTHINKDWGDRLPHVRQKLTKKDMEERTDWSTMAIYIRNDAVRTTALTKQEVNDSLAKEFQDNNTQLLL